MKTNVKFFVAIAIMCMVCISCDDEFERTKAPIYHSEIVMDDNYNLLEIGRTGQLTPDGRYYYCGSVTLFTSDEYSRTFPCFIGKDGWEKGCKLVVYQGRSYNLWRNNWVTIDGRKYKASSVKLKKSEIIN